MEGIATRPAREDDAADAMGVIERAYAPWRARLPDLPDVTDGVEAEIAAGNAIVVEVDGAVAGIAMARAKDAALHVMNLAVDPKVGGRGIGSLLMARLDRRALREGLALMRLATHSGMPRNVALYERLGWRVTGREGARVTMEKRPARV